MGLLSIEHSQTAYRVDFAVYGTVIAALAAALIAHASVSPWRPLLLCTVAGLAGWTALEYAVHRYVLHGLQPFARWHAEHHQRPMAWICAPTLLTVTLFGGLIFLPAWLLSDLWRACAFTLGVITGYLIYAVTHHAVHHWRAEGVWLRRRKRWHARHHRLAEPTQRFGVTTEFWDRLFGSHHSAGDPATGRTPNPAGNVLRWTRGSSLTNVPTSAAFSSASISPTPDRNPS